MGKHRVCPVELAGTLDNIIRRWLQNPRKILRPYVASGMTVLDFGCGPGFFSIDMAHMVGASGRLIAVDLQEGMLRAVQNKIRGTVLEERVIPHQCGEDKIGVTEKVDFILAFYVVHEIPHKAEFFQEIKSILKANGVVLIAEPPFHVSKKDFNRMLICARESGFKVDKGPNVRFSKTAILKKD